MLYDVLITFYAYVTTLKMSIILGFRNSSAISQSLETLRVSYAAFSSAIPGWVAEAERRGNLRV
jgi:hypothetical protein